VSDEYTARINRVLDHIELHLGEELTLAGLARVASFSPFHFHRIFTALQGETLSHFIQRLRLERAASRLLYNPRQSVTEIALDCGFSSPSVFARAFRAQFGVSASEWREGAGASKPGDADRKECQALRKPCEERFALSSYLDSASHQMKWRIEMKNESKLRAEVEVKELPELEVTYLRHMGPYQGDAALFGRLWGRLMQWAIPRGLFRPPETLMLTVYHDDPEITEEEKLRLSVCLSVPRETAADGEFGRMTVAGGRYAVARFEIDASQFGEAWNAVYGGWLPRSGFQPDDRPPLEICRNNPEQHPEGKHLVDICVPVRPL
jgi:AraC family transcriptional regulator